MDSKEAEMKRMSCGWSGAGETLKLRRRRVGGESSDFILGAEKESGATKKKKLYTESKTSLVFVFFSSLTKKTHHCPSGMASSEERS